MADDSKDLDKIEMVHIQLFGEPEPPNYEFMNRVIGQYGDAFVQNYTNMQQVMQKAGFTMDQVDQVNDELAAMVVAGAVIMRVTAFPEKKLNEAGMNMLTDVVAQAIRMRVPWHVNAVTAALEVALQEQSINAPTSGTVQ